MFARFRRAFSLLVLLLLLPLAALAEETKTPAPAVDEQASGDNADNLSTLGRRPDWHDLDRYQATITHDEFVHLLNDVYCTRGLSEELIKVTPTEAQILEAKGEPDHFILRFAKSDAERLPPDRTWTPIANLPKPPNADAGPLTGLHIALDPGHLGGTWAKMEERWFQIKKAPPVTEGDLTLKVAQMLAPRLKSLGAKVSLVRANSEPLTPYRPSDFEEVARHQLQRAGITALHKEYNGAADPDKEKTMNWQEEILFYRNSEIRRRASFINYRLQPDLVLCLHFNAEPWGDPAAPTLVEANHLHLLVNGAYLPKELELEDQRCEMLHKLLSRAYPEELDLSEAVAQAMAKATGLPPYHYKTDNVTSVGTSGYVYARNLMAMRLYHCPTIYLEPYVMNSREVFDRVEAGDYEGTRRVAGKKRPSIFREYVDGVVEGVLAYVKKERP